MGLLNFKKPDWQSKDAEKRLAAVRQLDPEMTDELLTIARDDQEKEIRLTAISRLSDIQALESLDTEVNDDATKTAIRTKLDELLCNAILNTPPPEKCLELLSKVQHPEIIAKISVEAESAEVRTAGIKKINDQNMLADIIKQKCGKEPALTALEKIDDEKILTDLSEKAASKAARRKAADKLAEIEAKNFKPDPMVQIKEKLSELLIAAQNLVLTKDWDKAAERVVTLRAEWQEYDSIAEHDLNQDFSKACTLFESKYEEICNRRKEEQEKASRFKEQQSLLENICSVIEALVSSTEDDTKQRYENAVLDWETQVKKESFKANITETLNNRYSKALEAYRKTQEKIGSEKKIYTAIVEMFQEAEKLLSDGKTGKAQKSLNDADNKLDNAKFKYLSASPIRSHQAELRTLLEQKKSEALEKNISSRKHLCEQLEALLSSEKQTKAEKKLKNIREEWHNLPDIDNDSIRELEQQFEAALDKLTDKQKAFYHNREWQGWANLNLKEKLLKRAENLDNEEDLPTIFAKVKELQKEWKGVGSVPHNVAQQLWERFHAACDRNYERCAPYREELKRLKKEADKRRVAICVRAEELVDSTEWRKTAEELKALQTEWKTLTSNKRHEEEKLFQRFRKACNIFFDNRHKNFESQEEKRRENLTKKEALCEEAEQLAAEPALESLEKFRDLQARWKKIGHVPRKDEDAIWKRFRSACDQFFNWLDEQRLDNLKQKEELCEKVEGIISSITDDTDRKEISTQLTALQEQWKEIGAVPADQKEAIWKRFHDPCDNYFTAQREHFKKIEAERLKIQELKEDYLLQAEEIGSQGIDKKTTDLMKKLQNKWYEAGHASREAEKDLNQRFKDICDSFFEGRRQHFNNLEQERLENLKSRESLCFRLEKFIGTASETVAAGRDKALTLAEELKLAMEENFMMAGRSDDKRVVDEEVKKIQQEWKKVGPVPREHDKSTRQRFKKALDTYYSEKSAKK